MSRALVSAVVAAMAALIAIHGGALYFFRTVGNPTALDWSSPLRLTGEKLAIYECPKVGRTTKSTPSEGVCESVSPGARQHLDSLLERSVRAGNAHLFFAAKLFAFHYMALLGGLIAASLAAVATFAIATNGWASTPAWIRVTFVVTSASLAFWIAVPQVFKYQENIETAEKIYASSAALIWDLRTFAASGRTKDGRWLRVHEAVASARERMDSMERIGLAFDQSKVGITGVQSPTSANHH